MTETSAFNFETLPLGSSRNYILTGSNSNLHLGIGSPNLSLSAGLKLGNRGYDYDIRSLLSGPSTPGFNTPRSSILRRGMSVTDIAASVVSDPLPPSVQQADLINAVKSAAMLDSKIDDAPVSKTVPSPSPSSALKSAQKVRRINPLVSILILRRMLLLTDGRDKVMKVVQYGLKTAMWARLLNAKRNPTLHSHANKTVSQFSMTRKVIRLFYWLNSLDELVELSKEPNFGITSSMTSIEKRRQYLAVLNAFVGIVNGWADDVVVAGKMGIVGKPMYNRAATLADQLWYVSIFIDVHENVQATAALQKKLAAYGKGDGAKREELRNKLFMQRISFAKLMADFLFCSIDVFHLGDRGISDGWQAVSGLVSALLGSYKVWVKHR